MTLITALFNGFSIAAIEGWLIALVPALTAVAAIVVALVKIISSITSMRHEYSSLKQSVEDKTNLEEAKAEMHTIIKQNAILREELEKLISVEGKVKYNGPEENE